MPQLSPGKLLDQEIHLPEAACKSFWLHSSTWQFPEYENADTFVTRLSREGLLVYDPLVQAVLQNQPQERSLRSVQQRFLQATGLTHSYIRRIERARQAVTLLELRRLDPRHRL